MGGGHGERRGGQPRAAEWGLQEGDADGGEKEGDPGEVKGAQKRERAVSEPREGQQGAGDGRQCWPEGLATTRSQVVRRGRKPHDRQLRNAWTETGNAGRAELADGIGWGGKAQERVTLTGRPPFCCTATGSGEDHCGCRQGARQSGHVSSAITLNTRALQIQSFLATQKEYW